MSKQTNQPTQAVEQEVSKILDECVKECNDGPTPWCFDSDIDHKYRNQIMVVIDQAIQEERSRVVGEIKTKLENAETWKGKFIDLETMSVVNKVLLESLGKA